MFRRSAAPCQSTESWFRSQTAIPMIYRLRCLPCASAVSARHTKRCIDGTHTNIQDYMDSRLCLPLLAHAPHPIRLYKPNSPTFTSNTSKKRKGNPGPSGMAGSYRHPSEEGPLNAPFVITVNAQATFPAPRTHPFPAFQCRGDDASRHVRPHGALPPPWLLPSFSCATPLGFP